jgi:hypothetical protein
LKYFLRALEAGVRIRGLKWVKTIKNPKNKHAKGKKTMISKRTVHEKLGKEPIMRTGITKKANKTKMTPLPTIIIMRARRKNGRSSRKRVSRKQGSSIVAH